MNENKVRAVRVVLGSGDASDLESGQGIVAEANGRSTLDLSMTTTEARKFAILAAQAIAEQLTVKALEEAAKEEMAIAQEELFDEEGR